MRNPASDTRREAPTYLINEAATTRVPRSDVRSGNRPDPPIVDQLSAPDGRALDAKYRRSSTAGTDPNRRTAPRMRDFTSSVRRRDRYRPGPSSATVKFRIERHALGPLSVRPVEPTVKSRIGPETRGTAAGHGVSRPSAAHIQLAGGLGSLLGRAGAARSGFCRGRNRRTPSPSPEQQ